MSKKMGTKNKQIRVLFVCTGNIFRSVVAEYCLKDYLKREGINNIIVSSTGTEAKIEKLNSYVVKKLRKYGIDPSKHRQRKLTKEILDQNDVVIAMAQSHQDFIENNFKVKSILFNEIAIGKRTSIQDVGEKFPNWKDNLSEAKKYLEWVVDYIYNFTPKIKDYVCSVYENG